MVRHFVAIAVVLGLAAGGLFAEEIKAVFKKYEDGKLTVTVDDKERPTRWIQKPRPRSRSRARSGIPADHARLLCDGCPLTLTVGKGGRRHDGIQGEIEGQG